MKTWKIGLGVALLCSKFESFRLVSTQETHDESEFNN